MKHVFLFVVLNGVTNQVATSTKEQSLNGNNSIFLNEHSSALYENDTSREDYSGHQLWKILIDNVNKRKLLSELIQSEGISTWRGNATHIDILIKPESINKTKHILENENFSYKVLIEDLQKAIDEENPPIEIIDNRNGHHLTWNFYHRWQDIHGFLDYLAQTYPDLCSVQTIGQSVEDRALKLIKISNGKSSNKAIWIDGGMHAREWVSPASATYIINELVLNFDKEPDYIKNLDWYIVPLVNIDGYEYTHSNDRRSRRMWRKNRSKSSGFCYGVDLNRNFGYRWGVAGCSKNPCDDTFAGPKAFSEPETLAIENFITGTRVDWKAYISFHSYGQYILYSWGYGHEVPEDHEDLENVGRKAAQAIKDIAGMSYTVGPVADTLYPAAGGSHDWAKGTVKMKYAYTVELRDLGTHGFTLPAEYIIPTAKEALAAVRVIAEAASKA